MMPNINQQDIFALMAAFVRRLPVGLLLMAASLGASELIGLNDPDRQIAYRKYTHGETMSLSWSAPTQNEDGSQLDAGKILGYNIRMGVDTGGWIDKGRVTQTHYAANVSREPTQIWQVQTVKQCDNGECLSTWASMDNPATTVYDKPLIVISKPSAPGGFGDF